MGFKIKKLFKAVAMVGAVVATGGAALTLMGGSAAAAGLATAVKTGAMHLAKSTLGTTLKSLILNTARDMAVQTAASKLTGSNVRPDFMGTLSQKVMGSDFMENLNSGLSDVGDKIFGTGSGFLSSLGIFGDNPAHPYANEPNFKTIEEANKWRQEQARNTLRDNEPNFSSIEARNTWRIKQQRLDDERRAAETRDRARAA